MASGSAAVDWNHTVREYTNESVMYELLGAPGVRAPECTAVGFGTKEFSSTELDMRATGIARALRSRGVGRWQHVRVCL